MEKFRATVFSAVGPWTVEGDHSGVSRIFMPHETAPRATTTSCHLVTHAARQLEEYFGGQRRVFDVVLAPPTGTAFQREVWDALRSLAYGEVATYGEVAQLVARPRAARAVGNANHANPWPIVVPCHRVVAHRGLGGYGGGEDVKKFLLSLEGIDVDNDLRRRGTAASARFLIPHDEPSEG